MIKKILKHWIPDQLLEERKNNREAKKLALTSKRLDLCSAQVAHLLHLAKINSLENSICVELGSGWVLSHALIFYLLGAKKVYATDVSKLASPNYLKHSVQNAIPYIVRDLLSPFSEHSLIRKRLNNLLSINEFSFERLSQLGIEYIAPFDFVQQKLDIPSDFIYSLSVLEHVEEENVLKLVENASSGLKTKGKMVHAIHLEDHKDIVNNPFEFLKEPDSIFTKEVQNERGNRIRCNKWLEMFDKVKNVDYKVLYTWMRKDKDLPEKIDSKISYKDENDLKTSHLGILCEKK